MNSIAGDLRLKLEQPVDHYVTSGSKPPDVIAAMEKELQDSIVIEAIGPSWNLSSLNLLEARSFLVGDEGPWPKDQAGILVRPSRYRTWPTVQYRLHREDEHQPDGMLHFFPALRKQERRIEVIFPQQREATMNANRSNASGPTESGRTKVAQSKRTRTIADVRRSSSN